MATSQQFDTLDGLVVTGTLDVGGNVAIDTNVLYVDTVNNRVGINKTPAAAFDVNGAVAITSGSVTGLTNFGAGQLSISTDTLSASANLAFDAVGDISLDAGGADVVFKDDGVQYGAVTNSSGNLVVKSGSTTALTFAAADLTFSGNTTYSNGKKIDFGSVMDITASANGATFSANTYHQGSFVSHFSGAIDPNTYLQFSAADTFKIVVGGNERLLANNSGLYLSGTLFATNEHLVVESVSVGTVFAETVSTPAALNFDLDNGSAFTKSLAGVGGTVTFTMPSTLPNGDCFSWTIKFENSGSLTWPASVNWSEGVQPPESSGTDIYTFMTYDQGTTIYGSLAVRNAS